MVITTHSRNELHNALNAKIGESAAGTLMEMLPPVGWADVATKRDLDHLAELMRAEFKSIATQKDLRQVLYTVLAFNLALVAAVLGATGLT